MTTEHILNLTEQAKNVLTPTDNLLSKKQINAQSESAKLAAQKAKSAEALAKALEKLEKQYIEEQKASNDALISKQLTSEAHGLKEPSHNAKAEVGKLFQSFTDKLKLNKNQKEALDTFLKNPEALLKKGGNLDASKFENASLKDVQEGIKLAKEISKTVNPDDLLTIAKTLTKAKGSNTDYLLEMAKASEVLGETIKKIAQNDVEMQKFDNETISAQMKDLTVMLDNIKTDTNDQVHQIKKAERAAFWKKFAMCFVAAVLIVVGAVAEIAGGSGTALIVAGVALMVTTLASSAIQKGMQEFAGLFTKNPKKREEIAAALSVAITVVVAIITTIATMGTDLPEAGLQIAAAVAKAAGQGAAMGAAAFSATGGAGDIAYADADAKYGGDVRNNGTADQQADAQKIEQTIGYIVMAIGIAGGLASIGGSFAASRLASSAAKAASTAAEDTGEDANSIEMTTFSSNVPEELVEEGTENVANETKTTENLSKFQKALKAIRDTKAGTNTRNFLDTHGYKMVGGFQALGTGTSTGLQIEETEAGIAAAYARLFAGIDDTTYHQGVKSIDLAQQGLKTTQTALEAQTVGQVQQEGVRTNIEQDAMIQQAKIIASVKV